MNLRADLAVLEAAEFIYPSSDSELAYIFKHALTQEAAYQSLLQRTRREVHQRVAQTYEELYADRLDEFAALLAQHYEVAGNTEKAIYYLSRAGERARGAFTVSQVSAGRKNRFAFEIFGSKAGVAWDQEQPDSLWIGHRNEPNQLIIKDPSLFYPAAATYADLPGGHSEGYDDTHKQLFKRFYAKVADPSAPVDYPTFEDGLRGMILLDKVAESAAKRAWVDV